MNKNWEVKKLGDVCTLQRGFDLPKNSRTAGNFPLVSSSGIIDTHEIWKVKAPGVVTGRSGSIGNVFYIEDNFWPLNTVLYIKDFHKNDARFVYYLLTQLDLKKYSSGTGVPTLNRNNVHDEMISVPKSLSEQQLIVSILDETFAAIDKAKENAEKNLQNARELFDSYLQSVFANPREGWEEKKLGEMCELISGQHIESKNYNTNSKGIGYLTGPSDFGSLHPIISKWTEYPKVTANKGDILITVKGSGVGKINLLDTDEVAISRQLMAIRTDKVETDFLYRFLTLHYNFFQSLSNGAAIPGISRKDVLNLKCPIPPLAEQQSIVAKLDALSSETKRLEAIYQQKLTALEELKKSVLQKAFNGELTGA